MKSSHYIFLISILATISVYGEPSEEHDYNESEIESCTHVVPKGLTIPKHLELKWKNKNTLPISVTLKNPFQENIKIPVSPSTGSIGYPRLDIECYDPDSKSWRLPLRLPGTFHVKYMTISYGKHKDFSIDNDFWWFITDSLPKITSQKEITIRLVYSFGDIYLRSEEFDWILKANDVKVKK